MKASDKLINAIKSFEGLRLLAYRCPSGVKTIGYGHTGPDVKEKMRITESKAEELLRQDLRKFEDGVNKLGVCKTQGQFDALVDFAFNCGLSALQGSTLLKRIKGGAPESSIRYEFSRWTRSNGKILNGLVKRRAWEADRYFEKDEKK